MVDGGAAAVLRKRNNIIVFNHGLKFARLKVASPVNYWFSFNVSPRRSIKRKPKIDRKYEFCFSKFEPTVNFYDGFFFKEVL